MASEIGRGQERTTIEVPRERLPWAEITESERLERLRTIIKREQQDRARVREEMGELREMVLNHRHGEDNTLLIPAGRRNNGGMCCEQENIKPGQEWF